MTALRGLLAHHDVTWIASAINDEDRGVAGDGASEVVSRAAAAARARPGCLRRLLQRRRQSAALVHAALAVGPGLGPSSAATFHAAWHEGTNASTEGLRQRSWTRWTTSPDAAVFFHDYHLYLAPRIVRAARPGCAARAVRAHPVAAVRLVGAAGARCAAVCTRACSRTMSSASTRSRWAPQLQERATLRSDAVGRSARGRRQVTHHPTLGRRRRVRRARSEARPCSPAEAQLPAARAPRRARRPHRPVEERRPRVPRFRAPARRSTPSGAGA